MIDVCQDVLDLEAKSGRGALDEGSTRIFHVYRFLCEYENGGLSGFLYNISPEWDDLTELQTIADQLKHPELAKAISELSKIVRSGPVEHRGTWGEWLKLADPANRLNLVEETISEHYSSLWDDLEDMTNND